jgi:Uma2 family endonuclease
METPERIAEASAELDAPQILATHVSLADYLEHYAERGCEWVEGTVYKMAPIGLRHENIRDYLRDVFRTYFVFKPVGIILGEPFVMRLQFGREPDLMIVLKDNPIQPTETSLNGPANICIEIVSPGTVAVDHGDKFREYEQGGVPEYWILDPIRNETRFYRVNEKGIYIRHAEDEHGDYRTPQLPGFVLHVATLWQDVLPNIVEIVEAVRMMLKE